MNEANFTVEVDSERGKSTSMVPVSCPECRAPNSDTAMVCAACGHSFVITLPADASWSETPGYFAQPVPPEPPEAKSALILSIVGFFCCGIVLGPIAIMKALAAKRFIAAHPGTPGGGKADIAIAISAISIASWLFGGIFRFWMRSNSSLHY